MALLVWTVLSQSTVSAESHLMALLVLTVISHGTVSVDSYISWHCYYEQSSELVNIIMY